MLFTILRQDITKMDLDAIVNAANTRLQMGSGVCGAIFNAAGASELQEACDQLAPIKTGEAVMTPGFHLPAKYIIHTVGPVYIDGKHGEKDILRACYQNSLKLAVDNECESIAFPLISSGIFGYPKVEALSVATDAIKEFLLDNEIEVYLTVFDKDSFVVSGNLLGKVAAYIDDNYVGEHELRRQRENLLEVERAALDESETPRFDGAPASLGDLDGVIEHLDEPFTKTLLDLIDAKGKTDVEVYKRANIDRKLFSKIRKGKGYMPSKRTAIALAISLELSLEETDDLLERAGYALSHSQKFDVIIEYFIINRDYDIFEINEVLFQYDQPLLGG